MGTWNHQRNPERSRTSRKILGVSVLRDLNYSPDTNSREEVVYNAKHGRDWNVCAYIDKDGLPEVRGYGHIKCIGRTLMFKRL